ncbi:hypothetical protein [Solitalea koreensis]|uniref:Protein required for attachment to host cells n=1 Tax=Solitalea koreensis TaxID=543615 RepID=A0A521CLL8_9SPHI|nr:hypothetical protein [Solitalea koreensis]SMO59641.1 hypothetical protein SAMN06265350_104136 [Solitalea koreensis]
MKNQVGIWIDSARAVIISLNENGQGVKTVNSSIEGRIRIPGENNEFGRFFDQESKKEARIKEQSHEYFNDIVNEVKGVDELVIFGPSLMKKELDKYMQGDYAFNSKNNPTKIHPIETADSMTDNQLVAWVKNYYKA